MHAGGWRNIGVKSSPRSMQMTSRGNWEFELDNQIVRKSKEKVGELKQNESESV